MKIWRELGAHSVCMRYRYYLLKYDLNYAPFPFILPKDMKKISQLFLSVYPLGCAKEPIMFRIFVICL